MPGAADRFRITNPEKLGQLRVGVLATAAETGRRIAALSLMPDHIHMAMGSAMERLPQDIALAFLNCLARAAGVVSAAGRELCHIRI